MVSKHLHLPDFYSSASAKVVQDPLLGALLVAGTTYYVDLGPGLEAASRVSPQLVWDAAIIITSISPEETDFPDAGIALAAATLPWSAVPTSIVPAYAAVPGGAAGTRIDQWYEMCSHRVRLIVVVGATGGRLRLAVAAKGV
jgi:hypothetical protein